MKRVLVLPKTPGPELTSKQNIKRLEKYPPKKEYTSFVTTEQC
jgi:hypothetical protein